MNQATPALLLVLLSSVGLAEERPPNIVFLMADELAYFELGHMGNAYLRTPRIDAFAEEGIRFTQALAVAPVCAALRCGLMTGKHMGHASVRANDGGAPLRAEEETIASMLKARGYATGGFGKWGAGGRDSTGVPEAHGFDVFFGYYDQVHAHSYYPAYLIRNSEEVPLAGNDGGRQGETYSHYAIMDEALSFIRDNKDGPFFCYLPITPPHGMYDIPGDDPAWKQYEQDAWLGDPEISQDTKNYAAMVTMIDNDLGRVLDLLNELDLEEDTLVFFTGDNGGEERLRTEQHPHGFFGPNLDPRSGVLFRGGKRSLYEGGLRIPFLARWPGHIDGGQVSDLLCYQPDVLSTLAELTGAQEPADVDGLSILPTLLGGEAAGREQQQHEFLYWEYRQQRAVRIEEWKGIRPRADAAWELYDLGVDLGEHHDVASAHPQIVERMQAYAESSYEPVRAGSYSSRKRHEADRAAKWGSKQPAKPRRRAPNRIQAKGRIPAEQLKLLSFSSENVSNDRLAAHAVDGDSTTLWHSRLGAELARHPHELVIDLGALHEVRGFRYLARQDRGWNGAFAETEIYLSTDLADLGEPALELTFTKRRKPQAADLQEPVRARYVRIRVLSEVNGGPWASATDIAVLGEKAE